MDILDRAEKEKAYARLLSKLLRAYGGRLLEKLGDPPSLENLPPTFWDDEAKELIDKLNPTGQRVFLDAAMQFVETVPIGVDWALVNQHAIEWAARYTFDLVSGITNTNRDLLRSAIGRYFGEGQTIGQLEEKIMGAYGPVRAEMIAVTEVTRAAVQGELVIVEELRQQGVEMEAYWQTNNDELVCPICSPLNKKKQGDGWTDPPPAHPRCRCWINHRFKK